jgi:hypothetical protein
MFTWLSALGLADLAVLDGAEHGQPFVHVELPDMDIAQR